MLCLLLQFSFVAEAMRLALVVVIDDLQPEIGVALDEGGAYVGQLAAPLAAVAAEHGIGPLIVLQPLELVQPVGPKAAALPGATTGSKGGQWGFSQRSMRRLLLLLLLVLMLLLLLLLLEESLHGRVQALVLIVQLQGLQLGLHGLVQEHLMHRLGAAGGAA